MSVPWDILAENTHPKDGEKGGMDEGWRNGGWMDEGWMDEGWWVDVGGN